VPPNAFGNLVPSRIDSYPKWFNLVLRSMFRLAFIPFAKYGK
jgi:hypothetical protein